MVLARADHLGRACAFKVCASALCAPCAMENRTLAVEAPARPLDEPRASCTRCAEEPRGAPASRPGSADGALSLSLARSGGEKGEEEGSSALSHRICSPEVGETAALSPPRAAARTRGGRE
nr:unnamed protein product [Digitaria exilis]